MKRDFIKILEDLSVVPNAPFGSDPRIKFVKKYVESLGMECYEDDVSIVVRAGNRNSKHKLVFISHLDHPGFILRDNKRGHAFGTTYSSKILGSTAKKKLSVRVYDPYGEYLGLAYIDSFSGKDHCSISLTSGFDIPPNSQALWDVKPFEIVGDKIYHISHDNDLPTSVLLSALGDYSDSVFDIYFVFTLFEEVFQYSSYSLAKNNTLDMSENDIMINLESMKVYSVNNGCLDQKKLNYSSGVVLNCSEKGCLYGWSFQDERNRAEDLVNNICENNNISIQRGLAGGSSDAWPFSEFGLTPHIVTLNVPNKYKHNVTNAGKIVAEEVLIEDARNLSKIVKKVLASKVSFDEIKKSSLSMSLNAKRKHCVQDRDLMNQKKILNDRLYWSYRGWVRRRRVVPENLIDVIEDFVYKCFSYGVYLWVKLCKRCV